MANLNENANWEPGIYQLELEDPVIGGPDGIDNLQAKQLANRTLYLKKQIETISNSIPAVPVQSVNGKTGDVELSAADVGTLTEQQLLEQFLPAKLKSGNKPIYEVGDQVNFKKCPTVNGIPLLLADDTRFAPMLWHSNIPPAGFICMWGQPITKTSSPRLFEIYGNRLPDAREQVLKFSSETRQPLTLEAGTQISEWVGSINGELWTGLINADTGLDFYEYQRYSSSNVEYSKLGSIYKKIRVPNIAFNLIVRYE